MLEISCVDKQRLKRANEMSIKAVDEVLEKNIQSYQINSKLQMWELSSRELIWQHPNTEGSGRKDRLPGHSSGTSPGS